MVNYNPSVVPILLSMAFIGFLYRFLARVMPDVRTMIFTPFLTILGGAYLGITNTCRYVLQAGSNFLNLLAFTGGPPSNLVNGVIGTLLSLIFAAAATYFIGFTKEERKA